MHVPEPTPENRVSAAPGAAFFPPRGRVSSVTVEVGGAACEPTAKGAAALSARARLLVSPWAVARIRVGIISALRPRSLIDRAAMIYVLVGISLPSFWIALVLAYLIGFKLEWTPLAQYCEVFSPPHASGCGGLRDWTSHMILPWVTLSIVVAGTYVRFVRAEVLETMNQDYVRTARAKGAPERVVMKDHILRNGMLPIVTMLGMDIGLLLGGAIFIEFVFALPGLGRTAIESISNFDLPKLQGVVIFGAFAIIVLNDGRQATWRRRRAIDPRIRLT